MDGGSIAAGATATMASQYTPPDPLAVRLDHLQQLVGLLNDEIRGLHAIGLVVLVAEDHEWSLRTRGGHTAPVTLPQVRIDVRRSIEDATSRPEANDG